VLTAAPTGATTLAAVTGSEVTPEGSTTKYTLYTANDKGWTAASTASNAALVNVTVDVNGASCVNPTRHAKATSYKYLNAVTTGCTTFGTDTYAVPSGDT